MKPATLLVLLLGLLILPRGASASIALVGTPTTTSQFQSGTIAVTYPTGHASGQVAVAFFEGTAGATVSATGWTTKAVGPSQGDGWGAYLLYRVLDGTEGSSVTFTITSGDFLIMAEMRLYSGVNTSTPFDTATANAQTAVGATGQPSSTGFTTLQSGDELIFFCVNTTTNRAYGTPTSFGNASLINDSTNGQGAGSWDQAQSSAGAIGSVTTSGGTSGDKWSSVLTALQAPTSTLPLVQQMASPAAITTSPSTLTLPANSTIGNLLTVECTTQDSAAPSPVPTISGLAGWGTAQVDSGTGNTTRALIWYAAATSAGTSVTATFSGTSPKVSCSIQEWAGYNPSTNDQSSPTTNSSTTITAPAINSTANNDLFIEVAGHHSAVAPSANPSSPWLALNGVNATSPQLHPVYQVLATAGTPSPSAIWTWAASAVNGAASINFFVPGVGGATESVSFE